MTQNLLIITSIKILKCTQNVHLIRTITKIGQRKLFEYMKCFTFISLIRLLCSSLKTGSLKNENISPRRTNTDWGRLRPKNMKTIIRWHTNDSVTYNMFCESVFKISKRRNDVLLHGNVRNCSEKQAMKKHLLCESQ